MPLWERQIEEWLAEKPERTAAADFDGFWEETQSLAQSQSLNPEIVSVDYPSKKLSAYQVSFDAFDRGRIQAWLLVPTTSASEKLPALIRWHDYLGFVDGSAHTYRGHFRDSSCLCQIFGGTGILPT